jgi:hypothetical protein
LKTDVFELRPKSALGAGALPLRCIFRFNNLEIDGVEPGRNVSYNSTTFASRLQTTEFHLAEFKRVVGWEERRAHLLLRQVIYFNAE